MTLAVFLAVSEPTGGHPYPAANQWLPAGLAFSSAIIVSRIGPPALRV